MKYLFAGCFYPCQFCTNSTSCTQCYGNSGYYLTSNGRCAGL